MSKTETNELEWHFRDLLFRNYNKGIIEFAIENIPNDMIETYLRYRNAEVDHISSILEMVLENLISSKFIDRWNNLVFIRDGISRLQCNKCYYICYLGTLEAKVCLRCQSDELGTFPKKR